MTERKRLNKTFKEFLEKTPPGIWSNVCDIAKFQKADTVELEIPSLYLYCANEGCKGYRFFDWDEATTRWANNNKLNNIYLTYVCKNCSDIFKTYALCLFPSSKKDSFDEIFKYGEMPAFGPPTPAKTITLIGPDKELFMTGRRAENQGMGIGAFVYYRRVVENQKNRIFDEIIRVLTKISPSDPVLKDLEKAKTETRFTKSVDAIKHALPQSLHINGQNPLTLLHSALSGGVHDHNESECLKLASSIRTILFEFADRLGQALKEEVELNEAVNLLAKKKAKKI